MATLAEKYRPQDFTEFKGSELTVRLLRGMIESGSMPSCLMFSGPRGCGKTTMARLVNSHLNAGTEDPLSYVEVDAASNNGVDEIRSLQNMVKYSHGGKWRVIVLDEAHSLSQSAFNAFLKTLEEPPPNTVFILVTTKPETIPDTVKSRAMTFRFHGLDVKSIARRTAEVAAAENIKISDPHVYLRIATSVDGSLRGALILLEQLTHFPEITVECVDELTGDVGAGQNLLYAMLTGSMTEFESELTSTFSKTYVMEKLLRSLVNSLKEFHQTNLITTAQFLSGMEVMWGLRKVYGNVDSQARAILEAGLYFLFSKSFWNGKEEEAAGSASPQISDRDVDALTQ